MTDLVRTIYSPEASRRGGKHAHERRPRPGREDRLTKVQRSIAGSKGEFSILYKELLKGLRRLVEIRAHIHRLQEIEARLTVTAETRKTTEGAETKGAEAALDPEHDPNVPHSGKLWCGKCRTWKFPPEFAHDYGTARGRCWACKRCAADYQAQRRAEKEQATA